MALEVAIGLVGPALKELQHASKCAAICDDICADIISIVTFRGAIFCDLLTMGHLHPEDSQSGRDLNATLDRLVKDTLQALEAALVSIQANMQIPQWHPQRYLGAAQAKETVQKHKDQLDSLFEHVQAHIQHATYRNVCGLNRDMETCEFDPPVVKKLRKDLQELKKSKNAKVGKKDAEKAKLFARASVQRLSPNGQVITAGKHELLGLALSPDGALFASCGGDGHIALWDTSTGERSKTKLEGHKGDDVLSVAWSPDGSKLVTCASDETAKIWDVKTGACVRLPEGHLFAVNCVAWSVNGKFIATCTNQSMVRLWNPSTGASLHVLGGESESREGETVSLWKAVSGEPASAAESKAPHQEAAVLRIVAWHPSMHKSIIATGCSNGMVKVWDAETGDLLNSFFISDSTEAQAPVTALAWKADGKILAAGSGDCTTRLWNVATGALVRVIGHATTETGGDETEQVVGHTAAVSAIAWHPEGSMLVTASLDGSAKMWNASTGALEFELSGHKEEITAVACTPCGRFVLTSSKDRNVRVYRRTGEVVVVATAADDANGQIDAVLGVAVKCENTVSTEAGQSAIKAIASRMGSMLRATGAEN